MGCDPNAFVDVQFKALHEDTILPQRATNGAAGYDLHARLDTPLVIPRGRRKLVPCGFAIAMPEGLEAQIRSRSGMALRHGVFVLNAPGTIDSDYRGEVGVILYNVSQSHFRVDPGDRIAQMVFARVETVLFQIVEDLPASDRGGGGFGSTGVAA